MYKLHALFFLILFPAFGFGDVYHKYRCMLKRRFHRVRSETSVHTDHKIRAVLAEFDPVCPGRYIAIFLMIIRSEQRNGFLLIGFEVILDDRCMQVQRTAVRTGNIINIPKFRAYVHTGCINASIPVYIHIFRSFLVRIEFEHGSDLIDAVENVIGCPHFCISPEAVIFACHGIWGSGTGEMSETVGSLVIANESIVLCIVGRVKKTGTFVEDGRTGFIVSDLDQACRAVEKLNTIDPVACRENAERNFSSTAMTDKYEALYYRLLER